MTGRSVTPDDAPRPTSTVGQVIRDDLAAQRLARAVAFADRLRAKQPSDTLLPRLVDCPACDGRGVMTSRAVDDLHGGSTAFRCIVCEGQGAMLDVPLAVVSR